MLSAPYFQLLRRIRGKAVAPERRWLIISYFSKIDGMACAQHIDDRLPYFESSGIMPIMLTGVCGERWPDRLQARVPSVAPSGIRFELRHLKRRYKLLRLIKPFIDVLLLPFYLLEKLFIDLDSQWSWFPMAIMRGYLLCRRYRPEVIYSTGGPASAHFAAAFISRWSGIPWVAELQDPIVFEDWLRSRRALRVFTWLECFICRRAGTVILLTDEAREKVGRRTGLGNRCWTIYPGADPANMPPVEYRKREHCHFSHFGSLGGSRNLKVFLEGMQLVFEENPDLAKVVRLDIYGTCDRLSRELIGRFPYPDVIRDFGRVPRRESLEAMRRSDVLLLIQNTESFSSETIPSKTYEYFHAGRPILGLVHQNPELAGMLESLGHLTVTAADAKSAKEGIECLVTAWGTGVTHVPLPSPFTPAAAVERLLHVRNIGF
jgi:glycosyl transferase family 4